MQATTIAREAADMLERVAVALSGPSRIGNVKAYGFLLRTAGSRVDVAWVAAFGESAPLACRWNQGSSLREHREWATKIRAIIGRCPQCNGAGFAAVDAYDRPCLMCDGAGRSRCRAESA